MVRAVARRSVAMSVEPVFAWQQPVERRQQVVVGAGADLDHDQPRRRMWHEDRQQPVAASRDLRDEPRALAGQVDQAATAARPDRELAAVYGKMLRIASRSRPSPPPTGADS